MHVYEPVFSAYHNKGKTGVSERHLRTMLAEVPHVYLGGRVVIPVEPLREWLRGPLQERSGREAIRDVRE